MGGSGRRLEPRKRKRRSPPKISGERGLGVKVYTSRILFKVKKEFDQEEGRNWDLHANRI